MPLCLKLGYSVSLDRKFIKYPVLQFKFPSDALFVRIQFTKLKSYKTRVSRDCITEFNRDFSVCALITTKA